MHSSAQSPPMTSLLTWSGSKGSGESHWPPQDLDMNKTQELLALRRGRSKPGSMVGIVEQKLDFSLHSPMLCRLHSCIWESRRALVMPPGPALCLLALPFPDTLLPSPSPLQSPWPPCLPWSTRQAPASGIFLHCFSIRKYPSRKPLVCFLTSFRSWPEYHLLNEA